MVGYMIQNLLMRHNKILLELLGNMCFVSTGMISYNDDIVSTLGKGGEKSLHENKLFEVHRERSDHILMTLFAPWIQPYLKLSIYRFFS